jgi:hypothetical protein
VNPVTRISPVNDVETAMLMEPGTLADLAEHITMAEPARTRPARAHRRAARRRVLILTPVAAALAVAGLVITSLGSPGQKVGPISVGPPKAQAAVLSFSRHGGYLDVIVKNPLADARRYRAAFAKYGLDISLTLVPASPSLVGTLVYMEAGKGITPISAQGKCFTGGGGYTCPVGVRVALDYKGSAVITFGRPPRPGERYETTGPVTAQGEAMHGMTGYVGKTAAAVAALLAKRHVTVADYWFQNSRCEGVNRKSMPGSWFVTGADPWAPGEVALDVSKTWPAAQPHCAASNTPKPTPTATQHAG